MVAHISNTQNTGWMVGNCELALCDGLTDRSGTDTAVTDDEVAIITVIAAGGEQKKITASGGPITAPITTGSVIYGWEEIAGILHFRPGSGWVGVSEGAGILTIASGTTFATLRYTNGAAPSAAQSARMYADELPQLIEPGTGQRALGWLMGEGWLMGGLAIARPPKYRQGPHHSRPDTKTTLCGLQPHRVENEGITARSR